MRKYIKVPTFLLVALIILNTLCVSAFAGENTSSDIYGGTATGYTKASDVQYVKSGSYILNWGARDEDAVFLTTYALSFYAENDYADISALSGGSSQTDAHLSEMYSELQSIMQSAHTHQTSYGETRDLYKYTDCVNSDSSYISSFYSGRRLNGKWDSGATWNREHTWPNSKGMGGNDNNDIMMLRPTSVSENSSRGNSAYGDGSSYYDPNSESGGLCDLRGDVARIALYVYVRWSNTGKMWGSGGMIESLDILLEWMEQDPVDTWEMGRNDAVQSITGTRNVFVDYPEYAFLLFGEEIPSDMVTPSGEASKDINTGNDDNSENGNDAEEKTDDLNVGGVNTETSEIDNSSEKSSGCGAKIGGSVIIVSLVLPFAFCKNKKKKTEIYR